MTGLFYGANGLSVFILLTVVLGGAAAASSGRALAKSWQPFWRAAPYMICLAGFVQFLHYALFGGALLSLPHYAVGFVVDLAFAGLGFEVTRRRQMRRQYGWTDEEGAR